MMTSVTHKLHAEKKGFYSSIPIGGLKLHVAIIKIQVDIMLYGVLLMGSIKAIQYKFKLFDYFPVITPYASMIKFVLKELSLLRTL